MVWLARMMDYLHEWADVASVLGLVASLVGFTITIVAVFKSKSAADQAQKAAAETRQKIATQAAIVDLNRIVADVEELKPLHRAGAWEVLPSRYVSLRRQLLALKVSYPNLSRPQRASIQGVIQQFKSIEEIVETALASKTPPPDVPALNKIAAEQGDKLNAILVFVQQSIGA
jgi:hypothetical protein